MTDLQSELAMLTKVLDGEKEKANNLQISFLEVMELKQHEVSRVLHFQLNGKGTSSWIVLCTLFSPLSPLPSLPSALSPPSPLSPPLSSPPLLGEQSPAAAVNCREADI